MSTSIYTASPTFRLALLAFGLVCLFAGGATVFVIARGIDSWEFGPVALVVASALLATFGLAVSGFAMSNRPISRSFPGFRPLYKCQSCGAALRGEVQVSPLGDVKCPYCAAWFNIHGVGA